MSESTPAGPRAGAAAGYGALAVVQLLFGLFPVFGRVSMAPERGFSPWGVASWRILTGALVLGAVAACVHRRAALPKLGDVGRLALCGWLGIVANQGLYLAGLERSTATNAGLLTVMIPVFTYAIAVLLRQERADGLRALGVLIAMAGVLPLLFSRGADLTSEHAFGNLLMVVNCMAYSLYLVLARPLTRRLPPLVVVAWLYLLSLPALPLFAVQGGLVPTAPDAEVWWAFAYVLVCATVLTYLLNTWALSRVSASTTAFFIYAQPLISALGGRLWLGEVFPAAAAWAAAALALGSLFVLRPTRREEPS